MKFNISIPSRGTQKCIEIDDAKKVAAFYDKKIGQEVAADSLGEEYKGYVFKITGGNDKQGFPMKQGVLVKGRVRLLLSKGHSTYRPRRDGERKRRTVRGCIVGEDIRVLSVTVAKKGVAEIETLTNGEKPRIRAPKRATKIRKMFGLTKEEKVLVRKNVIRRTFTSSTGKERQKAPKIQRLITEIRLRSKKIYKDGKINKQKQTDEAKKEYLKKLHLLKEQKAKKHSLDAQKRKESHDKAIAESLGGQDAKKDKAVDKKKLVAGTKGGAAAAPAAGKAVAGKAGTGKAAGEKPAAEKTAKGGAKDVPKKSADTKAAAPKAADTKPAAPKETKKPAETKPADTKPAAPKETKKPAEPKKEAKKAGKQ